MPSIPPIIISPDRSDNLFRIQTKGNMLPPLSVGEIVKAEVIEQFGDRNVLILLKGKRITADSALMHNKGERVKARVEQIQPRVILRIVGNQTSPSSVIRENIGFYRLNPTGLIDFFNEVNRIFSQKDLGNLFSLLGKENMTTILKMVQSLTLSQSTLNTGFFKDYIYNLGYLMEKELGEALTRKFGKASAVKKASHNLKGLLLALKNKLHGLTTDKKHHGVEKLLRFIDLSVKSIEAHQVSNVVLQERDNVYLFNIPMLSPDGMGLAEIFLKFDGKDAKGSGQKKTCKMVCMFTMDALGDIIVETTIEEPKLKCDIYCQDQTICDFIIPFLAEIKERLDAIGYEASYVTCVIGKDMEKMKKGYRKLPYLHDQEGVNVVV